MQPTDVICIDDYWLEYALDDANGRENGMCIIIDLKKLSWRMMRWCTPYLTSTMLKKVDVLPVKEFKIHVVNSSFVANTLIKLIWPFVNDRIRKMVSLWNSFMKNYEINQHEVRGNLLNLSKKKSCSRLHFTLTVWNLFMISSNHTIFYRSTEGRPL